MLDLRHQSAPPSSPEGSLAGAGGPPKGSEVEALSSGRAILQTLPGGVASQATDKRNQGLRGRELGVEDLAARFAGLQGCGYAALATGHRGGDGYLVR